MFFQRYYFSCIFCFYISTTSLFKLTVCQIGPETLKIRLLITFLIYTHYHHHLFQTLNAIFYLFFYFTCKLDTKYLIHLRSFTCALTSKSNILVQHLHQYKQTKMYNFELFCMHRKRGKGFIKAVSDIVFNLPTICRKTWIVCSFLPQTRTKLDSLNWIVCRESGRTANNLNGWQKV